MSVSGLTSALVELSAYSLERIGMDAESEKMMDEINNCTDSAQVCDVVCKYLDVLSERISERHRERMR